MQKLFELDAPPVVIERELHLLLFAIHEEDTGDPLAPTWVAAARLALESMVRHIEEMAKSKPAKEDGD